MAPVAIFDPLEHQRAVLLNPEGPRMRIPIRATMLAALLAPAGLTAQSATAIWKLEIKVPDSLQQKGPGIPGLIDLRATMATNGKESGFQLEPSPEMIASFAKMDLTGARLTVAMPNDGDSVHVGIVMPPDVAAMMGGGIGFRLDFQVPDSLPFLPGVEELESNKPDADSLAKMLHEMFRDTGRSETVAGTSCKVWKLVFPDSTNSGEQMSMNFCIAKGTPALLRLKNSMGGSFKKMQEVWQEQFKGMNFPFANQDMVPIKVSMDSPINMTYELISATTAAPDNSFFTLPEGLQPFPMEMITGAIKQAEAAAKARADSAGS